MKRLVFVLFCLIVCSVCNAGTDGKKLIEYGNDVQNTTSVRQHVREYEATLPFDGLVMAVSARNGLTLGWHMFETEKLDPVDFQQAIDDLKATKFEKFTDNFIQTLSSPSTTDWFDPNWSNVAYNASLFARVAKQGGCKGLMFDAEMYNQQIWSYVVNGEPRPDHTFKEYQEMVRQRGREFIRAINKEFPDVTLLCLFGPSQLYMETGGNPALIEVAPNVLLSAFFDGICEAATPETIVVDGCENAYNYRRKADFIRARKYILEGARELSLNPKAYKKHMRAGFGICPESSIWNPDDYSKNYHTPAGFRAAENYALELSDKYVWVYSGAMHWLDGVPPKEYLEALTLGKESPGPGEKNPVTIITVRNTAANMDGYSDEETFAEMKKTMTELFDFPKDQWLFSFDDFNSGVKDGWHKKDFDDSAWRNIMIGKWWEEQIGDYNGVAWYRKKFTAPQIESGKKVFVAVGAADDFAKVWLNGKYLGEQHLPISIGWNVAFALDATKVIKPGQENVLAIQVEDPGALGGLWKSVKLMVK